MTPQLGLIVNPVAGLGGRVGLKGSDGAEVQTRARQLGAQPLAQKRAAEALQRLDPLRASLTVLTYPGEMGERIAKACGFRTLVFGSIAPGATTAEDTIAAAIEMRRWSVDLILFAGGDGTARDMARAVSDSVPVLGIPAGVKILSAAFATNPSAAGDLARSFLAGEVHRLREAEVLDLDESAYRAGHISPVLFGTLKIPDSSRRVQGRKSLSPPDEHGRLEAIAQDVIDRMRQDTAYIVGPGTTTRPILLRLGLEKTLVGVDVVFRRRLLVADANEASLVAVTGEHPVNIIVTPIGGQGFVFGRGNPQISPAVLRATGLESIDIVSTPEKMIELRGRPLLVDTGDPELDHELCGFVKVITGYDERMIYRVGT